MFKETVRYEPFLGGSPVEDVAIYYSDDSRVFPGDNGGQYKMSYPVRQIFPISMP